MLLEIEALNLSLREGGRALLRGINLSLQEGDSLTVLGMSGSGKTMLCNALLQTLDDAVFCMEGAIRFCGRDLCALRERDRLALYGGEIVYIPQNPMTAFDPSMRLGRYMAQVLRLHENLRRSEAKQRVLDALAEAGLPECARVYASYPHQLSGGMRQRVMIAMALSTRPQLLIADEPTTALDVTIQAQILDLIQRLKEERDMSIIMITHDLGVVAEVARRVAVMYMGQIVEEAAVHDIFREPLHPYTQGLLRSIPKLGNYERLYMIPNRGAMGQKPAGCRFCPRCEYAMERCAEEEPRLTPLEDGRKVRCWLWQPNAETLAENNPEGEESHA